MMSSSNPFGAPSLRDRAVSATTLAIYNRSLSRFLSHTRLPLFLFLSLSPRQLDTRLTLYIEHLFESSAPFDHASHALHAVVFRRPELRSGMALPLARQSVRAWARTKLSVSHPPLTWELAVLFAVTMSSSGHHAAAVALLLSFDGYLRVGEMTRLVARDIIVPNDSRVGSAYTGMALALGKTKTGLNQSVTIRRESVTNVMMHWMRSQGLLHHSASRQLVFPFSPAYFRRVLHSTKESLGLGATPYVPHSLRHGGATYDFMRGASINDVMLHGRWQQMKSASRYVQTGRALLAANAVPPRLNQQGLFLSDRLERVLTRLMDTVPLVPSRSLAAAATRRTVTFAAGTQ